MQHDNVEPQKPDFSLLIGGAELLNRVQPLWLELRQHHAGLAPRWSNSLLSLSFEQRQTGLLNKSAAGLLVLLATSSGTDVGYCVNTIAGDGTGEVDSLYVVQSHRGCGAGHAMMSKTLEWFASCSVKSIAVEIISGNDAAQRFYAQYGFAPRTVRLQLQQ
ncbi:MAG TPA: GNAT family N-acetyltransferase [Tepidisphaeraceae bacterium]|jgi:ribosomal protein S18 acetylase RimI-like enzyme|nr:GNAT family N-acetyltransferase [Tepidisphaeraceae bacterium]